MNKIISTYFLTFLIHLSSFAQQTAIINTKRDFPIGVVSFGPSVMSDVMGSDNFVDGYINKSGSSPFVFPVGDEGFLRPFAASADETTGAYFGVNPSSAVTSNPMGGNFGVLPAGGPFDTGRLSKDLKSVSNKEYWDINGSNSTKITLTWTANSELSKLVEGKGLDRVTIVGWDGSKWVKITSKYDATSVLGGSSELTKGSITTEAALVPDTYNVYSLGALSDGSLPVTLVSFNANQSEQSVRLDWATSSEINSSYFDIQRSQDGKSWSTLGNVLTRSTENTQSAFLEYGFVDFKPLAGDNYYRLKMVDKDETFAYSNIRHLRYGGDGQIVVYPNPVSQRLFLTGFPQNTIQQARMIDMGGKSVSSPISTLRDGIDVSKLPSGNYVLNLTLTDGQSKSFQVLVKQ